MKKENKRWFFIKVVIPVAGKGTRMRPHTHTKPKPLLHIAGKPVIDHIIDMVEELDVSEYIFITGYMKESIEDHIKSNYDFKARFVEQKEQKGTAHAIKLVEEYVAEPMLVIFADSLFKIDLSVVEEDVDGAVWVEEVENPSRFGIVEKDNEGFLKDLVEKPENPKSNLANIGIYYLKDPDSTFREVDNLMQEEKKTEGEYCFPEVLPALAEKDKKIEVCPIDWYKDCGTLSAFLDANKALLEKRHKVKEEVTNSVVIEPVYIEEGARVSNSIVGPHTSIGKDAVVEGSIVKGSIIDSNAEVSDAKISDSIIGENALHKGSSKIVYLGDHSEVNH